MQTQLLSHSELLDFQLKQLFYQYVEEDRVANILQTALLQNKSYKKDPTIQQMNMFNQSETHKKLNSISEELLQNYFQISKLSHSFNDANQHSFNDAKQIQQQMVFRKPSLNLLKSQSNKQDSYIQICQRLKYQVYHDKAVLQKYQQYYQKQQDQNKLSKDSLINKIQLIKRNIQEEITKAEQLQQRQNQIANKIFTYQSIIKQKKRIIEKQHQQSYNLSISIAQLKAQQSYLQKIIKLQQQKVEKQNKNLYQISQKEKQLKQKLKESKLLSNQLKDKIEIKKDQNVKIEKIVQILQKKIREICSQMKQMKVQKQIQFFQ